uniref:Histone-lysine N-methyltransferase SETD2 (inferred by orthology to a human protein) n=1 Tax=Strongyloides venezuelensis TaxID=75913 RepID=A0A0K0FF15_STRVS
MFFTIRKFPRIYSFKTNNRGFGVKFKSNIKSNAFITSYIGDVFNNFTIKIILASEYAVKTIRMYLQMLSNNNIICSYSNGNMSRFINHSCEPNARIEKWISGKRYVLGIFAIKNISKDEEITVDYGYGDIR